MHNMKRSLTQGSNTMAQNLKTLNQKLFMSGKVTPKIVESVLWNQEVGQIMFSYPKYNQNDGFGDKALSNLQCQVNTINEPLFKVAHHHNIAELVLHKPFEDLYVSIGIKKQVKTLDTFVLSRAVGTDGKDGKDGKVVALRKFLAQHGLSEHARNIEVFQQYMSSIPKEVQTDLQTLSAWQATIPGVNPKYQDLLEYNDVLSIFGSRVTVEELRALGFLHGNVFEIESTLSWLAKSFVLIRIPGSLVDLMNFVRAVYSTTAFANLPIEDIISKLITDKFVLPVDAWKPTILSIDGEIDDDLVVALYKMLFPKGNPTLIVQIPENIPPRTLEFYKNLKNVKLTFVVDPDSKNGPKLENKGY